MTVTLKAVAQAIADTAKQADPSVLEALPYMNENASAPCVMVNLLTEPMTRRTFDGEQFQYWYLWVLLPDGDREEATDDLYDYIDTVGTKSIYAAFDDAAAAWRSVSGLSHVYVAGFGRVPSEIQGPAPLSWGGPSYWGIPLLIKVVYGN